jgi:hypothetical protein
MVTTTTPFSIRFLVPVFTVAATVAICFTIARHADEEARRAPATCLARGCYCEAVTPSGVRQPIDAWSSLAAGVAGAIVLGLALGRRPERRATRLARSRVPGLLLGLAASSIAVFSFHYHATLTWLGEWLDGISLYLLAGFGLAWAIARLRGWGGRGFAAIYVAVATVPAALSWLVPATRKPAFIAVAATAIAVELSWRRRGLTEARGNRLAIALGSFVVACVAWALDWHRIVCAPDGRLQLHALWHLLSAPTVVALYGYFSSEKATAAGIG